MTAREYVYRVVEVVRVVDGDTYWFRVDPGFRETILVNIRLAGYDTPEQRKGTTVEREAGQVAYEVALDRLAAWGGRERGTLWVRTEPDPDDFGRWLGDVWFEPATGEWAERHLGVELREMGLASVWPTRWHDEFEGPPQ